MHKGPFVQHKHKNWQDFLSNAHYFADDMGFIFRGHGCSEWGLQTTLERIFEKINPEGIELESTYEFLLSEFVKAIRGRSKVIKNNYTNTDELWALGQHHGLATPLLDWTRSMYVALFFAFEHANTSKTGYRSIWALNTSHFVRNKIEIFNNEKKESSQFKIIDPISDENPRLISQTGLFTKHPLKFNLVEWVNENLEKDAPYLIKIDIPDAERLNILRHLRLMNIHPATLFPEVDGAAKYCNQTLELLSHKRRESLKANKTKSRF